VSVEEIVRDLHETASLPLPRARTLRPDAYLDPEFFALEKTRVLGAGWLCAGHVSQLKGSGACLALDLLDEPIVILRDETGAIRVLSRVCPHRGADIMQSAAPGCGQAGTVLSCPYHRWTFGLDGTLLAAPQMHKAEGFVREEWRLAAIRCAVWHGFIFVNLDGQAPPLDEVFGSFGAIVTPWRLEELELVISLDWECRFNWKVMVENWIESYHHLGPHTKTLNPFAPAQDSWSAPPHPGFIHAHLPLTGRGATCMREAIRTGAVGEGFLPLPGLSEAEQADWQLFLGFPCFMLLLFRDRAIWYRLQPVSAEYCRLTTTTLVSRASLGMARYQEVLQAETDMLRTFHLEDMAVNEAVQHGLHSRHAMRGRLSHLEEPVWQFQRQLAAALVAP
jgi:phenylpropionate dioxygenase-like ring-hydroxylating dioxygenase large terminal subunit